MPPVEYRKPYGKEVAPVPPFATPKVPDRAFNEGEVVAETRPFVAWINPLSDEARVVAPFTDRVPVAVRLPPRNVLPATSSLLDGEDVPTPNLPFTLSQNRLALF